MQLRELARPKIHSTGKSEICRSGQQAGNSAAVGAESRGRIPSSLGNLSFGSESPQLIG